jgi:hypothetical protein
VLAVAGMSVLASSAHAASSTMCTGSSTANYSPGLTNTPQTDSWTEADTYSSCTSTDTSLTAGTSSPINLTGSASCNSVSLLPTIDYTISWNNSQSSAACPFISRRSSCDRTVDSPRLSGGRDLPRCRRWRPATGRRHEVAPCAAMFLIKSQLVAHCPRFARRQAAPGS